MKNIIEFIKKKPLLFSICLFEGATVMIVEILAGHLLNLHYGNSIVLWSSILSMSLLALSLGYFAGSFLSEKKNNLWILLSLFIISVLLFLLDWNSHNTIAVIAKGNTILAEYFSAFVLIVPILFLCAVISPIIIRELKHVGFMPGQAASVVFTVSTFSGILSVFSGGFYFIPEKGLKFTSFLFGMLIFLNFIILLSKALRKK